jgi:hypothetical protein
MTFGFALLTVGALMLLAGSRNVSVQDVLRGVVTGGPGPGEVGVAHRQSGASALTTLAVSATSPLGSLGMANFEGTTVCGWIADELRYARSKGWTGSITSGYRSAQDQRRVCSEVPAGTPCAKPGQSNHQGKAYPSCAVDVSDPAGLNRALQGKRGRRLHWTGPKVNDAPHFSSGKAGV